jgi:ABC-type sugar transport system permease subunit
MIVLYIVISLINVFLHIVRSILVIKSGKMIASLSNCICYTFSAVVIKFIAEVDLWIAIAVQASTNFLGCYLAMLFCDWMIKDKAVNVN